MQPVSHSRSNYVKWSIAGQNSEWKLQVVVHPPPFVVFAEFLEIIRSHKTTSLAGTIAEFIEDMVMEHPDRLERLIAKRMTILPHHCHGAYALLPSMRSQVS